MSVKKFEFSLIMPMAGRASRFTREGFELPKPLIDLCGRPFFWWAAESILRSAPVKELVFVVLEEHKNVFQIDLRINEFYRDARIVSIPEVTAGAAETAIVGINALLEDGPVVINDCDHAFDCPSLNAVAERLSRSKGAALMCFRSENPAYSYALLDGDRVIGTVEKKAASPFAIAGCYMFSSRALLTELYEIYRLECPYNELFISGLFNNLVSLGGEVIKVDAQYHLSFGTPHEHASVDFDELKRFLPWC